ncbi:MAG: biotin--[acetyl-CoA-carboxylase] ligase [Leptolyngbya sp. PLA3]|nr:MAG: biotin--[acetyl-CoA-carboxylase] ligase [Cyanobacteria bacterium CYA]MCE7969470.1 biotin--[acetyl-CoA-carboxylase] ligase [Leptolyngbya sp. PL-A3]
MLEGESMGAAPGPSEPAPEGQTTPDGGSEGQRTRNEDLSTWADRLEATLARVPGPINRVRVLALTGSTQDAAWESCGGRGGLLVTTGRQVRGRGRLGRTWSDERGLGIAATFVVDARVPAWRLSMLAGVAASRACDRVLHRPTRTRWPNDVLEPGEGGRKLGGVLIEVRDGLAMVGVGVNVRQQESDWPVSLRERAVSLAQLGAGCFRIDVIEELLAQVQRLWAHPVDELVEAWREREWLIGRRCTIAHDGEQHTGLVRSIDPIGKLVLESAAGELHVASASASVVRYL